MFNHDEYKLDGEQPLIRSDYYGPVMQWIKQKTSLYTEKEFYEWLMNHGSQIKEEEFVEIIEENKIFTNKYPPDFGQRFQFFYHAITNTYPQKINELLGREAVKIIEYKD